ncbi:hypothetical protein D3C87_2058940 [compost metagenome]
MKSADAYDSSDNTASAFATMNARTPPTPRVWNGSSSGNANAVASPHIRKNKEVVMVFTACAAGRLPSLGIAVALGS